MQSLNNNIDKTINETIIQPRKRGRPRKNQLVEKTVKISEKKRDRRNNNIGKREIILRLPLTKNNNDDTNKITESEKMDLTEYNSVDEDNEHCTDTILTLSAGLSSDEQVNSDENSVLNQRLDICVDNLKRKTKLIKKLKEENENLKNMLNDSAFDIQEINTVPMNVKLVDNITGKPVICEKN